MSAAFDMSDSIQARSDQINFDDFLSGTKVVTISGVRPGSAEQPVDFDLAEHPGKAYRPSKSMRRVMVSAWGKDASAYIGKRLELYGDPEVKFGAQKVGGIKIAKMSHIDKGFTINLTATRGKKDPHKVDVLAAATPPPPAGPNLNDLFTEGGLDKTRKDERLTVAKVILKRPEITSVGDLNADDIKALVDQLAAWQTTGKLGEEVDNILDLAAIEAEGKA